MSTSKFRELQAEVRDFVQRTKPVTKALSVEANGETWDLRPSSSGLVLICVDGETFALTPDDADNLAAALSATAVAARFNAKVSR